MTAAPILLSLTKEVTVKIVPGGFLMPPRFVHEPGEPAYDAAQELARVLPDHPDWSQPYDGDTTAQKETGPRRVRVPHRPVGRGVLGLRCRRSLVRVRAR